MIGVTGRPCVGKTTFAKALATFAGVPFIDADDIVRSLYRPHQKGWERIKQEYGNEYVTQEGIATHALRSRVFSSPHELMKINALIHPLVYEQVDFSEKGVFEGAYLPDGIRTIVVTTPHEQQHVWAQKKEITLDQLTTIEHVQSLPHEPDFLIKNIGTINELRQSAHMIARNIL